MSKISMVQKEASKDKVVTIRLDSETYSKLKELNINISATLRQLIDKIIDESEKRKKET